MESHYGGIQEEELKNRVGEDWFSGFDTHGIIGHVDFSVARKRDGLEGDLFPETEYYMWAESKRGTSFDIYESFVQLILTIGKERTFDTHLPPLFLGAFDAGRMAFLPYSDIMRVFAQNDFNWNVRPSDHDSKEFRQLLGMVRETLESGSYLYEYDGDARELRDFIKRNFRFNNSDIVKVGINKNNFTHVYQKWLEQVKPTIDINWDEARKEGLLDADFYLADLLSRENKTIREKLFVLLESDKYRYNIHRKATGALSFDTVAFMDRQAAHTRFWQRYERPPREEYWDYIVERRDLLVPQDIRERKGSFFTPKKWVELSQEYIARELGEDWQDEYYVWDCAGGTGNLVNGLVNKYNVYVSTLDAQDVRVMHELIGNNSLNLLSAHVFQFDFLNGSFDTLPQGLRDIINDPERRKRLVVYINPPYAEASNIRTASGTGGNRPGVSTGNEMNRRFKESIGAACNELFALFLMRIYKELDGCIIANFSTLKPLHAPNFTKFRNVFQARLRSLFVVPANTFDNVNGQFPIGFHVWDTSQKETFIRTVATVYDYNGDQIGAKSIKAPQKGRFLSDWMKTAHDKESPRLAYMRILGSDMQNDKGVFLTTTPSRNDLVKHTLCDVTERNIIERFVYFTVRHVIPHTWLNCSDQYLYPNGTWKGDAEFQSDCLAYALFHGQNRITSSGGNANHFIPFTEDEVNAQDAFASHFMSRFINGGVRRPRVQQLSFWDAERPRANAPIAFSDEARAVMDAGRNLWQYYHSFPSANPNASFYDIRLRFQGVNAKGRMNAESADLRYTELMRVLRERMKILGDKIIPKVYEHGFLLG